MDTNKFFEALNILPEGLRFPAFALMFVGVLIYLVIKDVRKNKTLDKVIEGNNKMLELYVQINSDLASQYQLILVLMKRYSDNLSNEQLPTFVMLVFKNLEVRLLKIYIATKRNYDDSEIALADAENRIRNEGKNLFRLTMQIISAFKFRGQRISKSFCPNEFNRLVEESVSLLNRKNINGVAQKSLETIVDELTVSTTDRLQKDEKNV